MIDMDEQQSIGEATVDLADTPEVRVARGVALLDREVPDWRDRIDTDDLVMIDGDRCVVGQIERSLNPSVEWAWSTGLDRLGLDMYSIDPHDHGFITEHFNDSGPDHMLHDSTADLRDLWVQAITRE
jgi:hypothetical protein